MFQANPIRNRTTNRPMDKIIAFQLSASSVAAEGVFPLTVVSSPRMQMNKLTRK